MVLRSAAGGLAMSQFGQDAYARTQAADRAELLLEHSDFVTWLDEYQKGGPSAKEAGNRANRKCAHILRVPVVAAIFACYRRDREAANKFWTAVRDETGKTPDCPDRRISKYLLLTGIRNGATSKSNKQTANNREIYVRCLHAWNAWRTNKPTKLQYYPEAELPVVR